MKDNNSNSADSHEEEEDAISLSDFTITTNNHTNCDEDDQNSTATTFHHDHQSSDFFEFFNYDLTQDLSHADDIILCGKLIPFHNPHPQQTSTTKQQLRSESHRMTFRDDGDQRNFHHHRRWESLSELTTSSSSQSNSTSPKPTAPVCNSRSLDYQNLSRNSSVRSIGRPDNCSKGLKPRWYVLMFGSFRFRPEMELRDIKNRQVRRTPAATMFHPLDGKNPATNGRKSSWGLLKALVCKGNVTDDVMASVGCMPKV